MLLAGCQISRHIFRKEIEQGRFAAQGVNTLLPWRLAHEPRNAEAVSFFLDGRITILGRDFSVNVATRELTWLSTAPYGIALANVIEINYVSLED